MLYFPLPSNATFRSPPMYTLHEETDADGRAVVGLRNARVWRDVLYALTPKES